MVAATTAGRGRYPILALVAQDLSDLRGPRGGVVELPVLLFWYPDRTFDLAEPFMLRWMYENVLRNARRYEDLRSYLDGETLVRVWPELYLPKEIRRAWEQAHPELRPAVPTEACQ